MLVTTAGSLMRRPRTATAGAFLALVALIAAPVTAAAAVEPATVRVLEQPVAPLGDEPSRMLEVTPDDFAQEGAALPVGLQQALARDVGLTGAEWLAQSEAGNAAADVVAELSEVIEVVDARLEGYDLVVTVENAADGRLAESVGARVEFGSAPVVRETAPVEGLEPAEDLRGGMPYRFDSARCSIGFVGIDTSTTQLQMISAGHCNGVNGSTRRASTIDRPTISGGTEGSPLTTIGNGGLHVLGQHSNPGYTEETFYDFGITPVTNSVWVGKPEIVTWGNSTSGAPLSSAPLVIRDAGPAMTGSTICKSGSTTGWTCGPVRSVDQKVYVGDGTQTCPAVATGDYCVGGILADICVRRGDSGGPAVVGSRAVGVSSAASNAVAETCAVSNNVGVFATLYSSDPGLEQVFKVYPDWEPLIDVSTPVVVRNGTDFSGSLDEATIRHSIDIEFSSGQVLTTAIGVGGTWSIDASNAYLADATYEVRARWGEGSRSTPVLGSISIPTGAVNGRVTAFDGANAGESLQDARVRFHDTDGVFLSEAATNANGEYQNLDLAMGDYLVQVVDPSGEYAPTWYPSGSAQADATIVRVDSDQTTSNIDVSLPDQPIWPPRTSRLAGDDRYRTAAKISAQYAPFAAGTGVVYVATGTGFADALSAAAAAAHVGAPLLLTAPTSLPSVIKAEIERLKPNKIIVVGGTSVVSTRVENVLRSLAPEFERHAGADRYSTSRVVTSKAFEAGGATTAFVATGSGFADALAAAAAAGSMGAPVVLVDGSSSGVPSATRSLLSNLGVTQVYVAGGTAVVSNGILSTLRGYSFISNATRLAGSDRYSTSMAITEQIFPGTNPGGYFAVGTGYADALAGAALAGSTGEPLYIVPPTCVPPAVLTHMKATGVEHVRLLGGTAVLSSRVEALRRC